MLFRSIAVPFHAELHSDLQGTERYVTYLLRHLDLFCGAANGGIQLIFQRLRGVRRKRARLGFGQSVGKGDVVGHVLLVAAADGENEQADLCSDRCDRSCLEVELRLGQRRQRVRTAS